MIKIEMESIESIAGSGEQMFKATLIVPKEYLEKFKDLIKFKEIK